MTIRDLGKSKSMVLETIETMPDSQQQFPKRESWRVSQLSAMKQCSVIGPSTVEGMAACPCCNRQLKDGRQTLGEALVKPSQISLFNDDGSDTESSVDMDEDDCMMPGVLADGITYTIKQVLVQGWVHKKGTGMDWIGSRAWKPRWAVLAVSPTNNINFQSFVNSM